MSVKENYDNIICNCERSGIYNQERPAKSYLNYSNNVFLAFEKLRNMPSNNQTIQGIVKETGENIDHHFAIYSTYN